jgi:phage baseplate assembly protein W
MPLEVRVYKDLDLNFKAHPVTKDVVKRTGNAAIIGALRNLILTNLYEKPFQPNFGSRVRRLLFEDVSFITANILQTEISNVIANFEPRVGIDAIRVQANPERNRYDITIRFFINNLEAPVTINFFLEKVRYWQIQTKNLWSLS